LSQVTWTQAAPVFPVPQGEHEFLFPATALQRLGVQHAVQGNDAGGVRFARVRACSVVDVQPQAVGVVEAVSGTGQKTAYVPGDGEGSAGVKRAGMDKAVFSHHPFFRGAGLEGEDVRGHAGSVQSFDQVISAGAGAPRTGVKGCDGL